MYSLRRRGAVSGGYVIVVDSKDKNGGLAIAEGTEKPEENECLGVHHAAESGITGITSRRSKDRYRNWHGQQRKQITYEMIKRLQQRILCTQRDSTGTGIKEVRDVTLALLFFII